MSLKDWDCIYLNSESTWTNGWLGVKPKDHCNEKSQRAWFHSATAMVVRNSNWKGEKYHQLSSCWVVLLFKIKELCRRSSMRRWNLNNQISQKNYRSWGCPWNTITEFWLCRLPDAQLMPVWLHRKPHLENSSSSLFISLPSFHLDLP